MRLEINHREKIINNTQKRRLNKTLLNNQEITEEIKEEIKKYLKTNDNENTTILNLSDAAKAAYIFFSSAHGTFSRIDHILGHKSNLSKFKKIEIISSIFSDHNTMRLEINYRAKKRKKHKHMQAKQYVTK